jgi:hypothetical protein
VGVAEPTCRPAESTLGLRAELPKHGSVVASSVRLGAVDIRQTLEKEEARFPGGEALAHPLLLFLDDGHDLGAAGSSSVGSHRSKRRSDRMRLAAMVVQVRGPDWS